MKKINTKSDLKELVVLDVENNRSALNASVIYLIMSATVAISDAGKATMTVLFIANK
jgi:hypothetical protein